MLEVYGLHSGYGEVGVLWDVCLSVGEGEIVAVVGSNGAGKSTLLKSIAGLLKPTAGRITFGGRALDQRPCDEVVRAGIALVPEGRRLFAGMTVRENLLMGAMVRGDRQAVVSDLNDVFELFPILCERPHQLAGTLSGGEQQMCAIGRGLMARPRLLMIDELSLGLAPVVVDKLVDALRALNDRGTALLVVEQDLQVALELASRGYVLEHGHIAKHGPSPALLADPDVRSAYLGI